MQVRPGMRVTREVAERPERNPGHWLVLRCEDCSPERTSWGSDCRSGGALPSLSAVEISADDEDLLPDAVVEETFASDYGRTLNLNDLQQRMKALQTWMADQGYSLARVSGPQRVSPDGVVTLKCSGQRGGR